MENLTRLDSIRLQDPEILATQWLTAGQFEEAGIPCRKGPFVEQETQNIREAIKRYQTEHKLNDEQLDDLLYSGVRVPNPSGFWSYIARAVPQRGVKSIYYHVRRARDPLGKAGKWDAAEDKELLSCSDAWKCLGCSCSMVQRSPADCSDRYRQHLQYKDTKCRGAWSPEEENQLLCAIEGLAKVGITDMSAKGFWVSVSKALGGTRTPKQCQGKWSDTPQFKIGNKGKARWSSMDSYILICKIASLDVDVENDIDWKSLNDPSWMWSSSSLQRRWKGLKASIGTDGMSHRDVVYDLVARTRPILTSNNAPSSSMSSPI